MTGIKAFPFPGGDEHIDSLPRQLDDELAPDEHGKDPVARFQLS
jgi:hypothetical protein